MKSQLKTESPNFSRLSNLLMLLLATQLIVFVYWLVGDELLRWSTLGLYSIYCLWLILLSIGFAEILRKILDRSTYWGRITIWVAMCSLAVFVVECGAAYVQSASMEWLPSPDRFFRFWMADMLVLFMVTRGWLFFNKLQQLDRAESESRIEALQARIQPHFLFNSLNTIAELTASMPDKAEDAIHSLAMLFRVSLENQDVQHSLKKELTLCERFVSLESWRFSEGLAIEYDIKIKSTRRWLVPKLVLQPLIENAIKYGAPSETGRPIQLAISESDRFISIKIVNAISSKEDLSQSNGVALANTQDRLNALYDDRYTFSKRQVDDLHYLLIQIPKVKVEPSDR